VTEVLLAQGRTALLSTVRPERQWAMLRHHAGVDGLARCTALRVADLAERFPLLRRIGEVWCQSAWPFGAHGREVHMTDG